MKETNVFYQIQHHKMSLKTCTLIFGALIFSLQFLYGQSSFLPKNLGPSINSTYDEINPVLSPDGKTIYFVRVNHPENTFGEEDSEDIWYSNLLPDGTWSTAQRDMALNVGRYNAILSLSPDGNTALINGVYNKAGTFWKKRGLSVVTKTQSGWSTPEKVQVNKLSKRNRGLKSSGMMSNDGKFIVLSFSRAFNGKRSGLFYSIQKENGKYTRPRAMKGLKSPRSEDAPFLSADNKTLYFSSDVQQKGHFDIFKSTRTSDSWKEWGDPIKLNDTINSTGWDSYFKTNARGGWGYFSSTEKSLGGADIFTVKLFEENPFVIVSGRILNATNKRALVGKVIKISVPGVHQDSIKINRDSATYKVKLPLGKLYSLSARVKNYLPASAQVDVSSIKEFTKIKKDISVEPLPYVLVQGRILDRSSGNTIPADAKPIISLVGATPDSISIDPITGTYSLKVKYGKVYKVNVAANNYRSLSAATLDVSALEEYSELSMDLYVDEDKSAVILGNIIDKKTGKSVSKSTPVAIRVEGMTSVRASVDSIAGTYELKLPLGSNYTISASAPNYYPLYEVMNIGNERSSIKIYKDLVIVPIEVGQSIRLNNIFFEIAKSQLKPESFSELNRVVQFLKDNPEIKIEIGGHTDNVGKAASNMKLSQARAAAVASYIISKGIPKTNIVSKGYGSTKPVTTNATKTGKAQNRRVEFTILDK